ncbi:MAG: hypothetical protein HYZ50_05240 [Deltaproteobacteria bacterium]|nr:hypothetical protein [Deltaproteobacteria bacterium]
METLISLTKLTPSTLTRPRGEVVGRELAAKVEAGAIELDLSNTSPSLSFLDGLILTLQKEDTLERVTFVTKDPTVRDKLTRISRERSLSFLISDGESNPQLPAPHEQNFEFDEHVDQARAWSTFAQI